MPKLCKLIPCGRLRSHKGWCNKHWMRWRRYGDPLACSPTKNKIINWLKQASVTQTDECIIWPFAMDELGSGAYKWKEYRGASRVMCYLAHGEPPTPKHIARHSCGVKACVNRRHLSWQTKKEAGRMVPASKSRGKP